MRELILINRYIKDVKRMQKRGLATAKLEQMVDALLTDKPLPQSARPHKLVSQSAEIWDAHVAPDWILLYEIDDETLTLRRTGTHADLF